MMSLRDRVRNGAAYSVTSGGLSDGNSKSPYDRYPEATRPQAQLNDTSRPRLRQRIAARGATQLNGTEVTTGA